MLEAGEQIADEVATALFAWPVPWDIGANAATNSEFLVPNSNVPRRPPAPNAPRYGIDTDERTINGAFEPDGAPDFQFIAGWAGMF